MPHNLASLEDAWNALDEEFQNAPEVGYVWTINIDNKASMSALGLAGMDYHLKLSCSHVGETMFGAWGGEMAFDTKSNFGGLKALMALMGSALSTDADVWFKNDHFLMKLRPYDLAEEQEFVNEYAMPACGATTGDPAKDAAGQALVNSIQLAAINGTNIERTLVNKTAPAGFYSGYYTNMTEGDLREYAKVTGLISIVGVNAHYETDEKGEQLTGAATAAVPLAGVYHSSTNEAIDTPFPYTISVFDDGKVVLRLYNSSGGPYSLNFYGTWDKIPVSETVTVKE